MSAQNPRMGAVGEPSREPTIAELMGWQSITPGCSPEDEWGEPTVDDMLEWLQEHLPLAEPVWNDDGIAHIGPGRGGWDVYWYCAAGADGAHGETLHAALSAAVRVVAGVLGQPGEAG